MHDTTLTIVRSASRFFSGTMLSRITGMLRDMALAYAFGTQSTIAALLVAFRFAHLFRRLFGEGALQTAFIPHFEELRKNLPARAGQFFCDLAISLTAFLVVLILSIMILLWYLPFFIDFSAGNAEILWLTFLMMPSLLFICLFGINASLLQCEKSYFVPSAAPVAFNLIWIIGIFCVASLSSSAAMSGLATFVVLACLAQWAITVPKTIGILKSYKSSGFFEYNQYFSKDVRRLAKPLILGIIGVAASQINNALDAIFARWADAEGPAFLWYAIRLQQLPLALFGIALSGALLPPLARALKNNDEVKYHLFLNFALRISFYLMVPMTAALMIMGDSCVNLIYGRGDFTSLSVMETTRSLWGYTLGLLPMALILVLAPAFYAKGDYRTPSLAATGAMIINITLNAILVGYVGLGTASVALATSISAWVNFMWLAYVVSRQQGFFRVPNLLPNIGKISLAVGIASISTLAMEIAVWGQATSIKIMTDQLPTYSQHTWTQLSHLAICGITFIITLVISALLLRIENLPNILSEYLNRLFDKKNSKL
ncbi:MAG: murein biosynthesis integral membrane protein MurJ [Parachlamydiaceae bacterium]|nr:murein biosynthesis integral membrane protein MurJ [Parachlamydiaceae bacterium]